MFGGRFCANTPTPLQSCNCNGISVISNLLGSLSSNLCKNDFIIVSRRMLLKLSCLNTWLSVDIHIIFITYTILLVQTQIKVISIKFWVAYYYLYHFNLLACLNTCDFSSCKQQTSNRLLRNSPRTQLLSIRTSFMCTICPKVDEKVMIRNR